MEDSLTSQQILLDEEVQEEQEPACTHHWKIDRPSGPISQGVCRICGSVREFHNYIEGSSWGGRGSDKSLLENLSGGSSLPSGVGSSTRDRNSLLAEDF